MRPNKYLYTVPLGDNKHYVIFNGINKEFLYIKQESLSSLEELIKNPNSYKDTHPFIMKELKRLNFIVDTDFDESAFLRNERENFIHAKEYKTTILPTFECNYSCWYCTQKHEPVKLDYRKFDLIIKHIKKYLIENSIEDYVLSWFGGEPLTQPNVIDYIAPELMEFCEKNNINFSSGITSNGALLNSDNIRVLQKCKVNYYQIAIDGDEKSHNKNKYDSINENSFKLVLTNIVNLLKINKEASVVLRINYTLHTLKSKNLVADITKYIPSKYRDRIRVDLQKVWQIKEQNVSIELLRNLQKRLVENNFELVTTHIFSTCYVEKEHYNMFYYNGGVEKCDQRTLDKLRGYLDSNGNIVWKDTPIFLNYNLFDNNCVCNNCIYYPLCYCGCPILREDRIKKNKGKVVCGYKDYYELFELRIQDFCWRTIYNRMLKINE